jgi:hypothetical protein
VRPHLASRLIGLATVALCACGFDDLFQETGAGDVSFVWVGDTVIQRDVPSYFEVHLLVDGILSASPVVHVEIPDTTVISFAATDSIVGSRNGFGDVVAWIESSLAPRIDTSFRIRSRP